MDKTDTAKAFCLNNEELIAEAVKNNEGQYVLSPLDGQAKLMMICVSGNLLQIS